MLKRLIILVLAFALVSVACIPMVDAQVRKTSFKQNLVDKRDEILQAILNNDLKDFFDLIILIIVLTCLGVVSSYISIVNFNEDNDLYPFLTQLFKKLFFIPAFVLVWVAVLLIFIFNPFPDFDRNMLIHH
jgi:ABC-type uncharacterized transport system fused permease/ATPase subunit